MSLTESEISRSQEAKASDNYVSELRCLIVMMGHLALDSEETNQSVIRPGLLRLASKVADRMYHTDGSINGREAMRDMLYHELKHNSFEQRFFDD